MYMEKGKTFSVLLVPIVLSLTVSLPSFGEVGNMSAVDAALSQPPTAVSTAPPKRSKVKALWAHVKSVVARRKQTAGSYRAGKDTKIARKPGLFGRFKRNNKKVLKAHLRKNSYVTRNEAKLATGLVKCSPDADVVIHNSRLVTMNSGDVLVSAKQPLVVKSGSASVLIAKDVIALVSTRYGVTKIRNLNESRLNSMKVVVDGSVFPVRAGQETVIADDFQTMQMSVEQDSVNRRALSTFELPNGRQLMSCEFEPVTLIKNNEVLRSMIHTRDRTDRAAFNKIMKMAACLQIATASHGGYMPMAQDYTATHSKPVGYTR